MGKARQQRSKVVQTSVADQSSKPKGLSSTAKIYKEMVWRHANVASTNPQISAESPLLARAASNTIRVGLLDKAVENTLRLNPIEDSHQFQAQLKKLDAANTTATRQYHKLNSDKYNEIAPTMTNLSQELARIEKANQELGQQVVVTNDNVLTSIAKAADPVGMVNSVHNKNQNEKITTQVEQLELTTKKVQTSMRQLTTKIEEVRTGLAVAVAAIPPPKTIQAPSDQKRPI